MHEEDANVAKSDEQDESIVEKFRIMQAMFLKIFRHMIKLLSKNYSIHARDCLDSSSLCGQARNISLTAEDLGPSRCGVQNQCVVKQRRSQCRLVEKVLQ